MAQGVIDTANYIQNLFKWEKPWDSFVGLIVMHHFLSIKALNNF